VIFLCVNYLARSAKAQVSKREKPFFSPKNSKKFFFLCKTPYLSTKLRFSALKKLDREVFSISGGSYRPNSHLSWADKQRNLGYCYPLGHLDLEKQDFLRINGRTNRHDAKKGVIARALRAQTYIPVSLA